VSSRKDSNRFRALWKSVTWVLLTTACVTASAADRTAAPRLVYATSAEHVVAAVLGHLAAGSEGPLLVDPRALRDDADLSGPDPTDLSRDSAALDVTMRVAVQLGLPTTDAVKDMRCAFVRGAVPPPEVLAAEPEEFRRIREACLQRGLYTTVALGTPRWPVEGAWVVRVVRMTTSSYSVWDIPVRNTSPGEWQVLEPRRLFGVMS
jgi:hypothetical protein